MKQEAVSAGSRVVRRIRVRALLFLLLALAAGGGAVFLVKRYLDRAELAANAAPTDTHPVVVAAMDVPIATRLTKNHIKLVQWPAKQLPAGSFDKLEQVLDRTVQRELVKGEPVLHTRLADEKQGRGLAAILPAGTRAMAVKVDQVVGVAGFVQPGDFVDVLTTMAPDEETKKSLNNEAAKISKIILQNIRVLAVGEHMTTKAAKPVKVQVVTLAVTPDQSERLALASRHGVLQLTMRSRIDQKDVPTAGVTPVALLSPDEGAEQDKEKVKPSDDGDKKRARRARRRRRRRDRSRADRKKKEKKPDAPVVEVLRGSRIEKRKLLPSADSKRKSRGQ